MRTPKFLVLTHLLIAVAVIALARPNAAIAAARLPYDFSSCRIDTDGDGIADCYETNTGVYVSPTDTGTDPNNPDTDGDGLSDGEEVYGTAGGLDLPSFGVSPVHKDILLEYDWMEDSACGVHHSHRPTQTMLSVVATMFANAPVTNPDGTTGIRVHQDVAPSTNPNSASNFIPDSDGIIVGNTEGSDYSADMAANFPANRIHYFHYVIFAHSYTDSPQSSGYATIGGFRMLIASQCAYANTNAVAYSIAHELGHNLTLDHGGPYFVASRDERVCNYKPNYDSIMNYKYQLPGIVDCSLVPVGRPDFSTGTKRTLDEADVYEPNGVCLFGSGANGPPPIDWNGNGVIDQTHYAINLNPQPDADCDNVHVFHDFNDWAAVQLNAVNQGALDAAP